MVLDKELGNDTVEVSLTKYASWGGYVKTILKLQGQNLSMYTVRNNWNGTGSEKHGTISLNDEEMKEIKEIMQKINEEGDFYKLIEKFEQMIERREKELDKVIEKLYFVYSDLCTVDNMLSRLERLEKEELREILYDYFS